MRQRKSPRASGITLAASAILASSLSAADQPTLPSDLAKAAADYDRAQVQGDATALNRLLAQDYHLVNGGGQIESKQQFVAESSDPAVTLDPFVVESPLTTVWDNGAVLAGEVHLKGMDHGKPYKAHFRFADIWRKRNGTWQVVFTEVTRLPAGEPNAKAAP